MTIRDQSDLTLNKSFNALDWLYIKKPMLVERKVRYSALVAYLVGWHTGAVSFPQSDVILAQLA